MVETQYRLEKFYELTLDVTGAGSIFNIGPSQPNERWEINKYSVKTENPPETYELVTNGGFEVDTSGWVTTSPGTVARTTAQAHTGIASAFFDPVSGGDLRTDPQFFYQEIEYSVSVWAMHPTASNRTITIGYAYYDENKVFLGSDFPVMDDVVPQNVWQKYTLTIPRTLGANAKYFRIIIGSNLSLYIDDVSVTFRTNQFIEGVFQVFRGNSQDSTYQIDYTETPAGDISQVSEVVRSGEYLSIKWTNGPPGARGTFRLEGLSIVSGKRAY